jgi:MFS family permease
MARTHALMVAGDAVMAVALAGSLFFSISPDVARGRVLLFLAITIAPFAVVAPLVGPAIDRMPGGRRLVVQAVALSRAVVALLMAFNIDSLLLFPLAFAALVLQKTYQVSKSALVPTVVRSDAELVEANSKLGIISGVVGFAVALPAALLQLLGSWLAMLFDVGIFLAALMAATRLPREVVAPAAALREEQAELRSGHIVLAASAMALLRASVGFLFFHLAFWLRDQKAGTALFGLAVGLAAIATMAGNVLGPFLRRHMREERMLVGSLAFTALVGVGVAFSGRVWGGITLMAAVNLAGAVGRLGFDSVVQRDAPDANRGRAFAQFETRFQLAWVVAGIPPVLIPLTGEVRGRIGFAVVGLLAAFAVASYLIGESRVRAGRPLPDPVAARLRRQAQARVRQRRAARDAGRVSRPAPGGPTRDPERPPRSASADGTRRRADGPGPRGRPAR